MLKPEQRDAIASLRELWPDTRIVLIGATALQLQRGLARNTYDMDLVIAVDVSAFPGALRSHPDWASDPRETQPQRWTYRQRTRFDLLPVGPEAIARGYLEWPHGIRMSVEAFGLLFQADLPVLLPEQHVYMAPVPLIMLLKMVAWLDRPEGRARDIEDLAWLFENYLDANQDDDFDRLHEAGFDHAMLLGQDIAVHAGSRDIAHAFLQRLEASYAHQYVKARGLSCDEDAALAAFKQGLGVCP